MFGSLKRRKVLRERRAAAEERAQAAVDLAAALREAEGAMEALRAANNRFYQSDQTNEQATLDSLRHSRERTFAFHVANELTSEAPRFARLLGIRASSAFALPLVEWIQQTTDADLGAIAGQAEDRGEAA